VTALELSRYSSALSPPYFFLFPRLKVFWKDRVSREPRTSLLKRLEPWQTYWKMGSRNASKSFMNVGKSVSLSKRTTLKETLCKEK
jgi:hypothetical protein